MRHPRDPGTHRSAIARGTVPWKEISSQPRKECQFDFKTIRRQLFSVQLQFVAGSCAPRSPKPECLASNLGLAAA